MLQQANLVGCLVSAGLGFLLLVALLLINQGHGSYKGDSSGRSIAVGHMEPTQRPGPRMDVGLYKHHLPSLQHTMTILDLAPQSGASAEVYKVEDIGSGLDSKWGAVVRGTTSIINMTSAEDTARLMEICLNHGPFDAILDSANRGEHSIRSLLLFAFPKHECLRNPGLYVVKDMDLLAMPQQGSDIWGGDIWKIPYLVGNLSVVLHHYFGGQGADEAPDTAKLEEEYKFMCVGLTGMHVYKSIMLLTKGTPQKLQVFRSGWDVLDRRRQLKQVNSSGTPTLMDIYINYNESYLFHHYYNYAPLYQEHFPSPGRPIKLLEMGVHSGGSTRVWRQFYGASLTYVGVDIMETSKRCERLEEHTYIEIGSQSDMSFLKTICEKYGPFDAIVDDAAHVDATIKASLLYLLPRAECLSPNGVYAVEDTHTMRMPGYSTDSWKIPYIFSNLTIAPQMSEGSGVSTGLLSAEYKALEGKVASVHMYDSIIFLHRSAQDRR